jgi:hypothetical protein
MNLPILNDVCRFIRARVLYSGYTVQLASEALQLCCATVRGIPALVMHHAILSSVKLSVRSMEVKLP